jgi:hypothetical protein
MFDSDFSRQKITASVGSQGYIEPLDKYTEHFSRTSRIALNSSVSDG